MFQEVLYPDKVIAIPDVAAAIDAGDLVGAILEDDVEALNDNVTILDARESGIARREKILGIVPAADATLADRKMDVQARWFTTAVYTENTLRRNLTAAMGDTYTLEIDIDNKVIRCAVELVAQYMYGTIQTMLDEMVPLDYVIDLIQKYRRYNEVAEYTHGALTVYTYQQIRSSVELPEE